MLNILKNCPASSMPVPIIGEKIPIYLGSWCRMARMGNATIFPVKRAITVCFTVITPESRRAPAAAKPDVNSAIKLKITTDRDSTGTIRVTINPERAEFKNLNRPAALTT